MSVHVAAGVLCDAAGRVLLAERPAGKHLAGSWEFPGGKVEAGESPFAGLKRELHEELGVVVEAAHPLVRLTHSYPNLDIDLDVWLVTSYGESRVPSMGSVFAGASVKSCPTRIFCQPTDQS